MIIAIRVKLILLQYGVELERMTNTTNNEQKKETTDSTSLYESMKDNISYVVHHFNQTDDLIIEDLIYTNFNGKLVFLTTMADAKKIDEILYKHIKREKQTNTLKMATTTLAIRTSSNLTDIITEISKGNAILFIDGDPLAYICNTVIEKERAPVEPATEKTVRGTHLGFVEDLNTNLHLLRKRITNNQLKISYIKLGFESNKNIAIIYFDHIANQEIVAEIKERVSMITVDSIFSPGYIEECIEDKPLSLFPQNLYTERPDRVEAHLLEGRIAIMTDGSTEAIILPVTFFAFFQTPDDYNTRFIAGSLFRILSLMSFSGVLILPPLYIALISFHFEIIPYELIALVKSSVSGVPFLPFFEAMFMAVTIELIREAGIRLPTPIGATIGIVGGIIISEAVVTAGLVSNVLVIVIALTAIMSFTIPSYEMGNVIRIASFPIMIAASLFGFAGIVIVLLFIIIHLCKLESFGVPYLSPLAPLRFRELLDSIIRAPVWLLKKRPKDIRPQTDVRQHESREWYYD